MKTITPALKAHLEQETTTLATCWKVTRRDGSQLGFTDHDVPLTIDGLNYVASSGYFRSAIANSATTAVDNLEVSGFLDDVLISEKDLRNGAYDYAQVEIFLVNWADLSMGILRLRYGLFGEVTWRPSGLFTVELRGLTQLFSQNVGEIISPECRADLGDKRCKVKLVPDQRLGSRSYKLGERVLVPVETGFESYRAPLRNANFDDIETGGYSPWTFNTAVVSNADIAPYQGDFFLRPTNTTGSATRFVTVAPGTTLGLSAQVYQIAAGWEHALRVIFYNGNTPLLTVLGTYTEQGLGEWIESTLDAGIAPASTTRAQIALIWRPASGATGAAQVLFDDVRVSGITQPTKMDFEGISYGGSALNWSNMTADDGGVNVTPSSGTHFGIPNFNAGGNVRRGTQVIDLSAINSAILDGHVLTAQVSYKQVGLQWGFTARVTLEFRDASNAVLASVTSDWVNAMPEHFWIPQSFSLAMPAGTRNLRLVIEAGLSDIRSDNITTPQVGFDEFVVDLLHADASPLDDFLLFGGVEFQCTTAGTTAATAPEFNRDLGETTVDGTVEWKAVVPTYTFLGTIEAVTSNAVFYVPELDAADNWFKWGVLTFLEGENIARAVEVLSWDNTSKIMTLMLPARFTPEVGERFRVSVGCDKTRGTGGCKRFSNILNFRGEPDVPGTDQYFRVGGAG